MAHIRWMIARDRPEVMDIESKCFEFPWTEDELARTLRMRNAIGMVAEVDDEVVGYAVYELHKNHLQLLNIAVRPDMQRHQIGTEIVEAIYQKLSMNRRRRISVDVRETNLVAQLFFKANGFRAIKVLRNYYDIASEDAYVMQLRFKPTEEENAIIPIPT
jgi:ribosomal-protein-alanine N-acetyltransferase